MSLSGQIVLITGASRGIGKAIAKELGQQGAYVVGTATSESGAEGISSFLQTEGIEGCGMVVDVSDKASIQSLAEQLKERALSPSILVNNAGITRDNLMMRMKEDEWESVVNTNLNSIFHLTQLVLRPMIKARGGRIINITSVVGLSGNPGQANYSATKAGMIGFTKSLARELAPRNITVNAVAPGFIETDMTNALNEDQAQQILQQIPLGRLGKGEDIAKAVSFLASPESSYITGQTLSVNGGMFMA